MTEIDRRPPTTGVAFATSFALLAAVATAAVSLQGAAGVGVAVVLVAVGLVRRSHAALAWAVAVGAAGLVFAATSGGGAGGAAGGAGDVLGLLVAAVALAVAWDVGDHALSLGTTVGRNARSARNQFVHAGTSLLVGTLAAGVGYGTYVSAAGGQPIAALVFLLFGAIVLVSAFR
ncbi:DUF7519 family protein [Haloparvum sp. PAK95]|uniref:DUF7519 family protein n=1 Tax=Haloparvum sp. PAK95 TaxID=3418962 RepID=UPI003D2F29F7